MGNRGGSAPDVIGEGGPTGASILESSGVVACSGTTAACCHRLHRQLCKIQNDGAAVTERCVVVQRSEGQRPLIMHVVPDRQTGQCSSAIPRSLRP